MSRSAKAGVALLFAVFLSGGSTEAGPGALPDGATPKLIPVASSPAYAAPPSYRMLVAREIWPRSGVSSKNRLISATISKPTERWAGVFGGGLRPIVCATTTRETWPWPQTTRWLVLFENGKIYYQAKPDPPAIYCLNVDEGPFPELLKMKPASQ